MLKFISDRLADAQEICTVNHFKGLINCVYKLLQINQLSNQLNMLFRTC